MIDRMQARLDELFVTKAKAALLVKRVEPFREAGAPGAFYEPPSADGRRPGMYYTNLRDMRLVALKQRLFRSRPALADHWFDRKAWLFAAIRGRQSFARFPVFRRSPSRW
jgi:Bacterial protein of unknown function (DUF885)